MIQKFQMDFDNPIQKTVDVDAGLHIRWSCFDQTLPILVFSEMSLYEINLLVSLIGRDFLEKGKIGYELGEKILIRRKISKGEEREEMKYKFWEGLWRRRKKREAVNNVLTDFFR